MNPSLETCSICMQNNAPLRKMAEVDATNTSWLTKLISCVPELIWPEESMICDQCVAQLEIVRSFRELCYKADSYRRSSSVKVEEKSEPQVSDSDQNCDYFSDTDAEKLTIDEEDAKVVRRKKFKCNKCSKCYTTSAAVQVHYKACDGVKRHSKDSKRAQFQCCKCHRSYTTSKILTWHEKKCGGVRKSEAKKKKPGRPSSYKFENSCELCPEKFDQLKDFLDHIVNDHQKDPKIFKPFKCVKCSNRYVHVSSLQTHLKEHDNLNRNICSFCGKDFKKRSDLHVHENIHLNRRSNRCELCDKGFNTYKTLRTHNIIKHRDPSTWPHLCAICNRRFPMKSNYDNHMRRHMGDKRFSCHVCEKQFVTRAELVSHMGSHTNVRMFKCEHCVKEYKDKRMFEIHLGTVHGIGDKKAPVRERKHLCGFCPKAFYDKNKLKRHLCTHTGERPFCCHLCDKKFTDKSYVTQHLKSAHHFKEEKDY